VFVSTTDAGCGADGGCCVNETTRLTRLETDDETVVMMFKALEDTIELIRMEYYDMPGMALTFWQAQRLWNLSDELCERALCALVRDQFLMVTSSGAFVRGTDARLIDDGLGAPVLAP
jgi:hypothetical protein